MRKILVMIPAGEVYDHDCVRWYRAHDIQRSIDGVWRFEPDGEGRTLVRYDREIDLAIPRPGFVKRRAEVRILNTVRELKVRAEA